MTSSTSDFAVQLQRLTYQLTRYYEICDRYCSDQIGIPAAQAYTLLAVPNGEPVTMNALSEKMGLAHSTMTHTVDLLVKKKLVERKSDPEDRRVVRIRVTAQGADMQARLEKALQDFFEQVAGNLPAGERQIVINSLRQMNAAILQAIQAGCNPVESS